MMISLRTASRVSRPTCVSSCLRQIRHESNTSKSSSGGLTQSFIGGLAGGGLVFLGGYTYYHFSGAKKLVNTARKTQDAFKSYAEQFKRSSPEPSEALEWLRSVARSYVAVIPGASSYVDSVFDDLYAVRDKHGKEVDNIIREAYRELKDIPQEGMSVTAATKAWGILQKHLKRISDLAGDAASDIMDNHPALKENVGGSLDQLKRMGDKYGPEAKRQVDETWDQIQETIKSGVSASDISKIQSLVQKKAQKVQELGGRVFDQGMEKAKPYLDKSPEAKELIEENKKELKKQGNVQELYAKVKDAVQSGNIDSLRQYVQYTVKKAGQDRGRDDGSLEKYLAMVPGGGEIIPKMTQLQGIAQEHGEEAEQLAKDTFKEIQEVLQRRVGEAEELAQKAKKT